MFGQVSKSYPDPMHVGDFPTRHALEVMVEAGGGEGLEVGHPQAERTVDHPVDGQVVVGRCGRVTAAPPDYHLTVDGMVDRPLSLRVADLEALPATRLDHNFQCVTGWEVPNVHWVRERLTDLAKHAGASAKASAFWFTSFDGPAMFSLLHKEALGVDAIERGEPKR